MTAERDQDSSDQDPEATAKMPRPTPQGETALVDEAIEDADPGQTIVRENWEAAVIRRVASHVAAVKDAAGDDFDDASRFGWESAGLQRLSRELQR